jgi:hypothetical protein
MDFINLQNRAKKPLVIALSGVGRELRGKDDGVMYNISLIIIVTMNPPSIIMS